jgi:hypothetical protein
MCRLVDSSPIGDASIRDFDGQILTGRTLPPIPLGLVSYMVRRLSFVASPPLVDFARRPFRLSPGQSGEIQTGRYLCLRTTDLANVPSVTGRRCYLGREGLRPIFQIVKTAQSRGRSERTLLKASYFCSPQAPSQGAGMLRTVVIRRFDVTLLFAISKSSRRLALMLFQWLTADARVEDAVRWQELKVQWKSSTLTEHAIDMAIAGSGLTS